MFQSVASPSEIFGAGEHPSSPAASVDVVPYFVSSVLQVEVGDGIRVFSVHGFLSSHPGLVPLVPYTKPEFLRVGPSVPNVSTCPAECVRHAQSQA